MALQKYIIFTPIFRPAVENHLKGHLGVLRNLGQHASHNMTCTSSRKVQKRASLPIPIAKGKRKVHTICWNPFMYVIWAVTIDEMQR